MDWYSILFLGVIIHLFYIEGYGEHKSFLEYINFNSILGLNKGTLALTIRFTSVLTLLCVGWLTTEIGLLSGFIIAVGFYLVLFNVIKGIQGNILRNNLEGIIWINWLRESISENDTQKLILINFILSLGILLVEFQITTHILLDIFMLPKLSLLLFLGFVVVFAGLGGIQGIFQTGRVLLYIVYFLLMFVPVYFYFKNGIDFVYDSVISSGYSLFPGDIEDLFFNGLLTLTGFTAILLIDIYLWQTVKHLNVKQSKAIIRLSSTLVAAIPFSFVAIFFYLSDKGEGFILFSKEMWNITPQFQLFFLIIVLLGCMSIGISVTLFQVTSLGWSIFIKKKTSVRKVYMSSFIYCFLFSLLALFTYSSMNSYIWIVYYGLLSVVFPFLTLFLGRAYVIKVPLTILFPWFIGVFLSIVLNMKPILITLGIIGISLLLIIGQIIYFRKNS